MCQKMGLGCRIQISGAWPPGIVIDKTTGKTDFNIRLKGIPASPMGRAIKIFKGDMHYLFDAGVLILTSMILSKDCERFF
jgi:hypothetical protein